MNEMSVITLPPIISNSGSLYVLENQDKIPFEIKRIYYITNITNDNVVRGRHAHKKLKQLLLCVGGSCTITLDNGFEKKTVILDNPGKILYITPCLWREITNFSEKATLIVFASNEYDESDYIREYDDFKKYIEGM